MSVQRSKPHERNCDPSQPEVRHITQHLGDDSQFWRRAQSDSLPGETPRGNELVALIAAIGVPIRDVLRQKETPYDDLDLGNPKWSDNELIEVMMQHLILINRPIVETPMETRLCRPSEVVLEL